MVTKWMVVPLGCLTLLTGFAACGQSRATGGVDVGATRPFLMGFSTLPPKEDMKVAVANLTMWSARADAAIVHEDVPWAYLLSGGNPATRIASEHAPLVKFYRAKGLKVFVTFDPTDGLAREKEARGLRAAGRSLAEPSVQRLYREWVVAWVTALRPEYVGLGAETNLVRLAAPKALYDALRTATNDAAAAVRRVVPNAVLYTTVQADVAWGRLQGMHQYLGIEQDLRDFPFAQAIGVSTYPYLAGFTDPDLIPDDYLTRLVSARPLPLFVSEGGWSSSSVAAVGTKSVPTTPALQAKYVRRMSRLLQSSQAIAWLQLPFADLDVAAFPSLPAGYPILSLFTLLGFVDSELRPKPALAAWDSVFALRRRE